MENKKDEITKKLTGQLASALPTKSTLDAIEHEQDLENQRQKRADSSIIIDNPANTARKSASDDGDKTEQNLSDDYVMEELEALKEPQKIGKPSPTPVIENEDENPSEDD